MLLYRPSHDNGIEHLLRAAGERHNDKTFRLLVFLWCAPEYVELCANSTSSFQEQTALEFPDKVVAVVLPNYTPFAPWSRRSRIL